MSSLTLSHKSAKEVAVRENKKKTAVKAELSYEEALEAIRKYDTSLKEAGKHRMFKPPAPTQDIIGHHICKGFIGTGLLTASEVILSMNGILPMGTEGFFIAMGTLVGGSATMTLTAFNEKTQRFFSPRKMRKLQKEYESNKALVALKEKQFAQLESDVLKKAKKPVKVIQKHLQAENRTLVYSGEIGSEGFAIQEKTPMDTWEQELFKAKASKERVLEASLRKELTA